MRLFTRDDERLDTAPWRFRLPRPSRALRPLAAAALVCLAALVLLSANDTAGQPTAAAPKPKDSRAAVPSGLVGVTVEVSSAAAATLRPGDHIDLLATAADTTTVAESALVLATGASQVFVAVPREAATRIAAIPADARITVTVRSP
ncbi:hypothetical protein [Fodinicola acaciae]|uniref:hypothetical protein n=1 Tax=Fodinicola acaciae TaxID=2681555 RepID=UPI0013D7692E|nr:hypothetical protein [Fodinicola acaciae]